MNYSYNKVQQSLGNSKATLLKQPINSKIKIYAKNQIKPCQTSIVEFEFNRKQKEKIKHKKKQERI